MGFLSSYLALLWRLEFPDSKAVLPSLRLWFVVWNRMKCLVGNPFLHQLINVSSEMICVHIQVCGLQSVVASPPHSCSVEEYVQFRAVLTVVGLEHQSLNGRCGCRLSFQQTWSSALLMYLLLF